MIRALAHRGSTEHGIELTLETLIPEVTVTATGVYGTPSARSTPTSSSPATSFPLQTAIAEVRHRFAQYRANAVAAAQWFPCA